MANEARYIIIGNVGSDAGYWVFDGHTFKHVGGWPPFELAEMREALTVLGSASRFKSSELSEKVAGSVSEFVTRQLAAHLPHSPASAGAPVVVIMAA